jgi:hypothetical protein
MREGEILEIKTSDFHLFMRVTQTQIAKTRRFLEFVEGDLEIPFPDWMQNAAKWEIQ